MYLGHDLKFDRESRIKFDGTPVNQMLDVDVPSPTANTTSRNWTMNPALLSTETEEIDPQPN